MNNMHRIRALLLLFILTGILLVPFPGTTPVAHADALQSIRKFFQLPNEVEKIQDSYRMMEHEAEKRFQQAQDEYNASYEQISEQIKDTQEDLEKAKATAEQFRVEQEKLVGQNQQLAEENRQLAATVEELRNTAELKEKANRRLRNALITGGILLAGAFFVSRFTRVALRRSR